MAKGWVYGDEEKEEEKLSDGQLYRLKREFILNKTKKIKKDNAYGFKLSELDNKITRADLGDKVQKLKL